MTKNRILLIEEKDSSKLLKKSLRSKGFNITVFDEKKEEKKNILEKVKKQKFDILLINVNLPPKTNMEEFERIQQVQKIPTIFLSSTVAFRYCKEYLGDWGVKTDFLIKPSGAKNLVIKIKILLSI